MPTYCEKVILFEKHDAVYFIVGVKMIPLLFLCLGLCKHLLPSGG